ncbi:MAG: hypothetical protein H7122_17700 [Chitinophagaceae bacterium]|nr:hypothetical protein [Chitinophagaceae bacterium]
MKFYTLTFFCYCFLFIACEQAGRQDKETPTSESNKNPLTVVIPQYRDAVSKDAVAQYQEKVENPLNDWYFSVKLYETPKTFHYLIKLRYEEIQGEDTLKLPNFGTLPKPVIQKGTEKYSCIIGFMDKQNKFREYKKVYVKDNRLKITALKHYAVAAYER